MARARPRPARPPIVETLASCGTITKRCSTSPLRFLGVRVLGDGRGVGSCRPWRGLPDLALPALPRTAASGAHGRTSSRSCRNRAKAHVEHPVGLVEHEQPDSASATHRGGRSGPLRRPGVATRTVRAAPQGEACLTISRSAVDGGDRQRSRVGDRTQIVDDLACQLARGRQDEAPRGARLSLDALPRPSARRTRASCLSQWGIGPARRVRRAPSGMTMLFCTAKGFLDPALRGALLRQPRTRQGWRTLHPSCVGAPSHGPLAGYADGDSTDPIRALKARAKTRTSRTTSPPVG